MRVKHNAGDLFEEVIGAARQLKEKNFEEGYKDALERRLNLRGRDFETASAGLRLEREGEAVFVKRDFHANENDDKLRYIFAKKVLYNLGVGEKTEFERDGKGDLITISRGAANTRHPENNKEFSEGDVSLEKSDAAKEKAEISAIADFLNLRDLKLGEYQGRKAGTYERVNYGVVSKDGANDKMKIFDFQLSDKNFVVGDDQGKILNKMASGGKLSTDGEFREKSWRAKHGERAGLGKIIEASYDEALKIYKDVYNKEPSAKETEKLERYRDDVCSKIPTPQRAR